MIDNTEKHQTDVWSCDLHLLAGLHIATHDYIMR